MRCPDGLFGKITKLLHDVRERARNVILEKIGYMLVGWRGLKGENLPSRSMLELLHESSFSCVAERKDIPRTIERQAQKILLMI